MTYRIDMVAAMKSTTMVKLDLSVAQCQDLYVLVRAERMRSHDIPYDRKLEQMENLLARTMEGAMK